MDEIQTGLALFRKRLQERFELSDGVAQPPSLLIRHGPAVTDVGQSRLEILGQNEMKINHREIHQQPKRSSQVTGFGLRTIGTEVRDRFGNIELVRISKPSEEIVRIVGQGREKRMVCLREISGQDGR